MFKNKIFKWIVIAGIVFFVLNTLGVIHPFDSNNGRYVSYSSFVQKIDNGEMVSISKNVGSDKIHGMSKENSPYYTYTQSDGSIINHAQNKNINIKITPESSFKGLFLSLLPILLLIGFFFWLYKQQSKDVKSIMNMGNKSKNKIINQDTINDPDKNPYRLTDVAGCDEAKREVSEIIDFLKNPEYYRRVGAKSPRGILMSGNPGTGKTLLAKAIAGEAGVPFLSASGSDFIEMFVGVGASRIRTLFEKAKSLSPAIVFIDEIDSIGKHRGGSGTGSGGNDEREQTLNALLVEMDGFTSNTNVVVIAATNRPDTLDQALLRPGRFDREVSLDLPDKLGRTKILEVHGKKIPAANDVIWEDIARGTPGFSGAELANVVNEAAVLSAREKDTLVYKRHFDEAIDKVMMGLKKNPLKNKMEREIVAYHEAGHAIVAYLSPDSEPVHKISITPRGRALGLTMQLPDEETYNKGYNKLMSDLSTLMGGRASEDLIFHQSSVGASNDFMKATVIARRMIASWGMDDDFGPISIDGERGNEWSQSNIWSESLKVKVDNKVRDLLKERYANAKKLLQENVEHLHKVAEKLLVQETMDANEFKEIMESDISASNKK